MAGGVWHLSDWRDWIGNKELGPIAFQFGTRPLLTQESPIPESWKKRLLDLLPGDVLLHRFSPTGFYSSAVKNGFLDELIGRSSREVEFGDEQDAVAARTSFFAYGRTGNGVWISETDHARVRGWMADGFTQPMRTPDRTLIFVTPEKARRDPSRSGRLHGLSQSLPLQQLEGSRRPYDRSLGRSAFLLHSEDVTEDRSR